MASLQCNQCALATCYECAKYCDFCDKVHCSSCLDLHMESCEQNVYATQSIPAGHHGCHICRSAPQHVICSRCNEG
eukprot:2166068-Karenia_brevis.AAC.1